LAEVLIDGQLSAQVLLPLMQCGGIFQTCSIYPINRVTCGPGASTDSPVTPTDVSFLIDVPAGGATCDWVKPRVVGYINHYYNFALGGPTFSAADGFFVDLKLQDPVETCFFQDGLPGNGNRAFGLTYTVRADAMGDCLDSDNDGFPDEDEVWGTNV